ncbi:hypothetical protein RIF29_15112 [Crotalaria pallida]|uniref:Regulator of rDNA transcription protein 15 n=1 Tax=Crotalaria pallida TaxID=3830 RepID=A0AAN9ICB6_CROPI
MHQDPCTAYHGFRTRPCTRIHAPGTRHDAASPREQAAGTDHQAPGSMHQLPRISHQTMHPGSRTGPCRRCQGCRTRPCTRIYAPGITHHAPATTDLAPNHAPMIAHQGQGTMYQAQGIKHREPGTTYLAPGTMHRAPRNMNHTQCTMLAPGGIGHNSRHATHVRAPPDLSTCTHVSVPSHGIMGYMTRSRGSGPVTQHGTRPDPWKSRHRRIKKQRRYERLAATSQFPCGNFSDTSSFKFRRTKGSIGHAFTVRIRTGNQNQTSFYPFVPHEISVLVELILGHLRYLLTDVPRQPNSPPDNVFRPDRPAEAGLGSKNRGNAPPPTISSTL